MAEKNQGCGCGGSAVGGAGAGSGCGGGGVVSPEKTSPEIIKTDSSMRLRDRLGVLRVRLGIRRNGYRVTPGLYALGNPGRDAFVFASANYKLSFDVLRRALAGRDAWILVLDTRGVNVWCAAGKGTFGTEELVGKIETTALAERVEQKRIILPQLGAPGVAAHEVEKRTGFKVVYGPVRAADIPGFLNQGLKADGEMRRVRFNAADRAKLVFVEGAGVLKYLLAGGVVAFLIAFFADGFSFSQAVSSAAVNLAGVAMILAGGTILTPLCLPWLPGRSFSLKGLIMGLVVGLLFALLAGKGVFEGAAWTLAGGAVSSFFAMGFTGASTYTNLSGTVKEMRRYIPVQIISAAAALLCFVVPPIVKAVLG